jgi:hypothetical protein
LTWCNWGSNKKRNLTKKIKAQSREIANLGITPVVAIVLLIAATVVLSLTVGAYSLGILGANVKMIQVNSASLHAEKLPGIPKCSTEDVPYMRLAINNPGTGTNITSIMLSGAALDSNRTQANYITTTTTNSCNPIGAPNVGDGPQIGPGGVTDVVIYFSGTGQIREGEPYNYLIVFSNGQSVSGTLLAQ